MTNGTILLTGATGFLGGELLRRLLEWDDDTSVVCLIRAPKAEMAPYRGRQLLKTLCPRGEVPADWARRVRFLHSDLSKADLGLPEADYAELRAELTDVIHSAAVVRFDLPLAQIRAVNVGGLRNLFSIAQAAMGNGHFRRFHHVSTIGVAGRMSGVIPEGPFDALEFNNTYEQSKAEAERFLLANAGQVPLTLYRMSQILGDSRTGWTPHFRMGYSVGRLVVNELLPALPIGEHTISDGITIDYAADALYALAAGPQPESGAVYQIVAGREAPTTREWVRRIFERTRLRPRELCFIDPAEFRALWSSQVSEMDEGTQNLARQLDGLLPHLDLAARWFEDAKTLQALAAAGVSKRTPYDLQVLDDYALRTQWGAVPEARPELPPAPAVCWRGTVRTFPRASVTG